MTDPTSLPPKRSPIWQTFNPCVTQLDCTFRKFERYSREMARTFKIFDGRGLVPVASAQRRVLRLEAPGDKRGESAGLFLQLVEPLEVVDPVFDVLAHAKHHGRGGAHAQLVRGAMHVDPVLGQALQTGDLVADFIVEDFRAASGNGIQARHRAAG